jgi:hypothetical protein
VSRALVLVLGIGSLVPQLEAASIRVKHREGTAHGFIVVHSAEGEEVASGEVTQTVDGDRVSSETTLYFKDGSIHDEATVFSQKGHFRLLTDHLRQSGPSFPDACDQRIDAASGTVTTQSLKAGESKPDVRHMKLPDDISNGLLVTVLRNVSPAAQVSMPMLVGGTSKPRVVQLTIHSEGQKEFSVASRTITTTHFVVHVTIGGVAGAMASVVGKHPPEMHFWVLGGEAPTFIRAITPLFEGGPIWTFDLAPVTPRERNLNDSGHSQ